MGEWWLIPVFFLIALSYASVGHGGASGYLAALSLIAVRPDEMATTALTLNVLVAGTALVNFGRTGHLVSKLTWPFLVASVPAAFVGGLVPVSVGMYRVLLAAALGVAALRLAINIDSTIQRPAATPRLAAALPVGGGIGWLSGAVGLGGGIFLSPLLLLLRWATPKQAAASSAAFIVANSLAGLGGRAVSSGLEYGALWPLVVVALLGGLVGAHLGVNHFSGKMLKRVLAVVLVVAAIKLCVTGVPLT